MQPVPWLTLGPLRQGAQQRGLSQVAEAEAGVTGGGRHQRVIDLGTRREPMPVSVSPTAWQGLRSLEI